MNKNDPINEAAICQRRLATLATREARDLAKVRERYTAKRDAITEGLSPAAMRVLAAVEPRADVEQALEWDQDKPEPPLTPEQMERVADGFAEMRAEGQRVAAAQSDPPAISPRLMEPIPPQPRGATKVVEDGKGGR